MRKSVVSTAFLLTVMVLFLGCVLAVMLPQPPNAVDIGLQRLEDTFQEKVMPSLIADDISWQYAAVEDIISYRDNQVAQEALQATLDAQKENARLELQRLLEEDMRAREAAHESEEAMKAEALNSIYASGGRDVQGASSSGDSVVHVPDNSIKVSNTGIGKATLATESATLPSNSSTIPGSEGREAEDTYLGQVSARVVCTCSDCWDASRSKEFPSVSAGDNKLLTDGTAVPASSRVTLDSVDGIFVTERSDNISGRNVIIFCANHAVATSSVTIYPKVTLDNSVG